MDYVLERRKNRVKRSFLSRSGMLWCSGACRFFSHLSSSLHGEQPQSRSHLQQEHHHPLCEHPLPYGVGLRFRQVFWYHFPKTGGTSMRFLLHSYCRHAHMNLSSYYGLEGENECATIPFSCHSVTGSRMQFTYGHVRDDFISYASVAPPSSPSSLVSHSPPSLYIFMTREPLSWLLSRHQHSIRKRNVYVKSLNSRQRQRYTSPPPTVLDTAREHGTKYFNFLPDALRAVAVQQFQAALELSLRDQATRDVFSVAAGASGNSSDGDSDSGSGEGRQWQHKRAHSSDFTYASSPPGLAAALDALLHPAEAARARGDARVGGITAPALVLVLVTDYYHQSLQLLDHVYATSLFTAPVSAGSTGASSNSNSNSAHSSSSPTRNRAKPWQEQSVQASSAELKVLTRLLEGHQALYQTCLKSFFRRYADIQPQLQPQPRHSHSHSHSHIQPQPQRD